MLGTCKCVVELFEREFGDIGGFDEDSPVLLPISPQDLSLAILSMALLAPNASGVVVEHLRILLFGDEGVLPIGQNDHKH